MEYCLGIVPLALLRSRLLTWFRHIFHNGGWINQCLNLDVVGKWGKGWPRKTQDDVIQNDLKSWNLIKDNVLDSVISDVKSATKASNQCLTERRC